MIAELRPRPWLVLWAGGDISKILGNCLVFDAKVWSSTPIFSRVNCIRGIWSLRPCRAAGAMQLPLYWSSGRLNHLLSSFPSNGRTPPLWFLWRIETSKAETRGASDRMLHACLKTHTHTFPLTTKIRARISSSKSGINPCFPQWLHMYIFCSLCY